MSTQRYISTSFWDDEWIQTLDPSEKLLYLYYMTNPLTNIAGVYKITLRRVCFDTGYNENTVKHIMDKFQKAKKAIRYGEYIILPSWPNHQKWQTAPRIKDGIIAILKNLPDDVLSKLAENGYKFDLKIVSDTVYIPYTNPSNYIDLDTDIDIDIDIDSDIDIEKDKEIKIDKKRFVIPTVEQIKEYCTERNNKIDAEYFFNYYQSKGWMIGKNKMTDWQSAVRTWENREKEFKKDVPKHDRHVNPGEDDLMERLMKGGK